MFTAERLTFHTHGDGEDVNIFHFFLSQGTNSLINQMKSEDDHLLVSDQKCQYLCPQISLLEVCLRSWQPHHFHALKKFSSSASPFFTSSHISIFWFLMFFYSYSKRVGLSSPLFLCQLVYISTCQVGKSYFYIFYLIIFPV